MVFPALRRLGSTGRNDSGPFGPHRERDKQQASVNHPDDHKPLLTIFVAIIEAFDGEWVENTLDAASKLTPCFARFSAALASSHSNPALCIDTGFQ
jgi:hypothetical protein